MHTSTYKASPGATCTITHVRGDVTTVRAAAVVRARKEEAGQVGQVGTAPPVVLGAFPTHLLKAGPA